MPREPAEPEPSGSPASGTATEAYSGQSPRARQDIPPELGRFVVLGRLGAGGMGVVYAAYDPELDRKVAVKLLHPRLTGSDKEDVGRTRLLREAQAMAQLSHPNVLTLFDVGTYGEQVFIAMEFVQGLPLSEWLRKPHTWREVVAVFLAAGRGLAAAHQRGIVHGDFKPDNVIVDAEGRARVLDFGLAFAQDRGERPSLPGERPISRTGASSLDLRTRPGPSGALTGTPPYISPEQFLGDSASALTDQYAFCVSLHEGLYGARPYQGEDLQALRQAVLLAAVPDEPRERRVPTWLRRILLRGMSRDPQQRFADMPALLAELARDRDRRRLLIGLGLATFAILTAGALTYRWYLLRSYEALQAARQGVCAGAARNLEGVWDADRRTAVAAAFRTTGLAYADDTWQRVAGRLDDYTAAWVAQHGDACQATYLRGEQSPALLDRRMACLHRAHTELRSLVDVLASADAGVVEHAAEATAQLPPLTRCADIQALLAERPPLAPAAAAAQSQLRETLARARAHERTMQPKLGLALVVPALTQAQLLADRPLLAEAHLEHGKLLHFAGEHAASERALAEAFFAAEASRSDLIAAQA
ncbi:MAG: serine/threonine protein kinase, partial [Myxococcales bacterium]|nr:serine/threonine protein kinase [Myxococcales bacterium]